MSYGGNFNAKDFKDQYEEHHPTDPRYRSPMYSSDHTGRHPNENSDFGEGISSNYAAKIQPLHDDEDDSALFRRKPSADFYESTIKRKNVAPSLSKSPPYASASTNLHAGGPKTDELYNDVPILGSESKMEHAPSLRSHRSEVHRTINRPILSHSTTGEYRSASKSRSNNGTTDIQQFLDSSDPDELADGLAYGVNVSDVQAPYPSMLNNPSSSGVYSSNGEPLANMNILTTKKEAPSKRPPEAEVAEGLAYGINISDVQDPYPSMRNSITTQGVYSSNLPSGSGGGKLSAHLNSSHKILPPIKEATPIIPPNAPTEPKLPRPRVSRRFLRYTQTQRQPDLALARRVDSARYTLGEDNEHVLKCPSCQSLLKLPKLAVLMQCPTCSNINPTTSTSSF
mmetsp:Transcript_4610/g.6656  ORF Transcript_4610/g.6656 Transcript_4610/m.6656 type:complete len:397 (+) Transcript_4610:183-1373(+)